MSITSLLKRADRCSERSYFWQGRELRENYGATEDMMQEFWECVDARIDSDYMKEYEEYRIAYGKSDEEDVTYISICGTSIDRDTVEGTLDEFEIDEDVEGWLDFIIEKLEEVVWKVNEDMNKIQGEIITKYNLIYVESEEK